MNCSPSIKELAIALAKAQGEFPAIPKNRTAEFFSKKTGETRAYKYADLADLIAAVTPKLSKHGLSITQDLTLLGDRLVLETTILHTSGEWKSGVYPLQVYDHPQDQGSAITYARRYTVSAMLGVHADEDADGSTLQAEPAPGVFSAASPVVIKAQAIGEALLPKPKSGPGFIQDSGKPSCENCKAALILSKNGQWLFCPNYQDKSRGAHARIPYPRSA
jgi:hypothetical protein